MNRNVVRIVRIQVKVKKKKAKSSSARVEKSVDNAYNEKMKKWKKYKHVI